MFNISTRIGSSQHAASDYCTNGWRHGLNPDALSNTDHDLAPNTDVAAAHIHPLLHFGTNGRRESRDPSAPFNTSQYLSHDAHVKAVGIDPLLHIVQYGQAEGRTAFTA